MLSEAEVAHLYERRKQWDVDREHLLDDEIKNSPMPLLDGCAYLYIFARPLIASGSLLERATKPGQTKQSVLHDLVDMVATTTIFPTTHYPNFSPPQSWIQRTEGLLGKMEWREFKDPGDVINIQINFDGSGHLFCGRAAEQESKRFTFFATVVVSTSQNYILGEAYRCR